MIFPIFFTCLLACLLLVACCLLPVPPAPTTRYPLSPLPYPLTPRSPQLPTTPNRIYLDLPRVSVPLCLGALEPWGPWVQGSGDPGALGPSTSNGIYLDLAMASTPPPATPGWPLLGPGPLLDPLTPVTSWLPPPLKWSIYICQWPAHPPPPGWTLLGPLALGP